MVDEFQDASQARTRLLKGLTARGDNCLFVVGDDWQSINRFAGADLGVMTGFEQAFGPSQLLKLETTFRCPPSLCAISSLFVQKNPAQIPKTVRSTRPDVVPPVRITMVDTEDDTTAALRYQLERIGGEAALAHEIREVMVMGRYRHESRYMPVGFTHPHLLVSFITVHASKGLECDHVILPRMSSQTLGFPSRIEDDPILKLAMPGGDNFEFAEERRLFYVALNVRPQPIYVLAHFTHHLMIFTADR